MRHGRCGAQAPVLWAGSTPEACNLEAGHAGWHRGERDTEWGTHRAGVGFVPAPADPLWMRAVARLSSADWWALGTAAVVGVVGGFLVGVWFR